MVNRKLLRNIGIIALIVIAIVFAIAVLSQGFFTQCIVCETDWIDEELFASFTGSWSQQNLPANQGGSLVVQNAYDEDFDSVTSTFATETTSTIMEETLLIGIPSNSEIIGLEFDVKGGGNSGSASIKYSVWNFETSSWDQITLINNGGVTDRNLLSVDALNHIQNDRVKLQTEAFSGIGQVWVYESRVRAVYTDIGETDQCTAEVFECLDGSSVGRDPNNSCEFFECGSTTEQPSNNFLNGAILLGILLLIFVIVVCVILFVRRK